DSTGAIPGRQRATAAHRLEHAGADPRSLVLVHERRSYLHASERFEFPILTRCFAGPCSTVNLATYPQITQIYFLICVICGLISIFSYTRLIRRKNTGFLPAS